MKSKILFYFTLAIISLSVLQGCNKAENGSEESVGRLVPNATIINFPVDNRTSNLSGFLAYFDNSGDGMLFSLNQQTNEILAYSMNEQKLVYQNTFDIEGPNGVGEMAGFHIVSSDSVVIFPSSINSIYTSNLLNGELKRLSYEPPLGYSNASVSSNAFGSNATLMDGKIIVKTNFQGNPYLLSDDQMATSHLAYSIDLNLEVTDPLPHFFPKGYWGNEKTSFRFSMSAGSKFVYAFFGDHSIYYSDPPEKQLTSKLAESKYFKKNIARFPTDGSRDDRNTYPIVTPHYGSIIYDEYREVYYRFCFPGDEIEEGDDMRQLIQFPKAFSVMVLDKDLNTIGETLFDKNKEYSPFHSFVGKKGLYVSINHPENPANKEDFMSFSLFELAQ